MKFLPSKNLKQVVFTVTLAALISACNEKSEKAIAPLGTGAIIATVASDYSSSALSAVQTAAPFDVVNELLPTISDVDIAVYKKSLYRFERYQKDTVTKYDAENLSTASTPVWEYSLLDNDETGSANPHAMVFESETKAYILRYGKPKAWIVDPTATTSASFKTGELDLSQYADSDGSPEMESGVIVGGKLFVIMQRLVNWVPQDAYVAVIDVASNTEIDTGNNATFKGIKLPLNNPLKIQYLSENGKIYVAGNGSYSDTSKISELVEIDPSTYSVKTVLDPANRAEGSPDYTRISSFVIASTTEGYFVDYIAWKNNAVYAFNPSTGVVNPTPVAGLTSVNIGDLAYQNGNLFVAEHNSHSVKIVNGQTHDLINSVFTSLNPIRIAFLAP